uniref:Putative extracellular protein TR9_084 n=1 Tax=Trebouxia lynnae TaxID=1825957 RepID=A0A7L9QEK6_9CHLO|nr:putative extracellular protein TR9_084 [Trebouxia lynnae]
MKASHHKAGTLLVALLVCCHAAQAATSVGALVDSAGQPLVQASSCASTPCLQGVAYAAGYLAGCQVVLSSQKSSNSTTTTSSNGAFSFPVDHTTLMNASISIPVSQANSSQLIVSGGTVYNCSDTATNQAPLFTLSAKVPENGSAVMVVNAITTSGAQTTTQLGLLPSILSSVLQLVHSILDIAGVDTPDGLFNLLSRVTADPPGLAAAPYVNALRNTSDPTLAQYLVLNGQIFNSLTLAAQRVAATVDAQPDNTPASIVNTIDQSVSEIFRVLVPSLASLVNDVGSSNQSQVANSTLTDVSSIATTLTSAARGITNAASNGSIGNTAGAAVSGVANTVSAIASAFGRRLLRDGGSVSGLAGRRLLQSTHDVSTAVATVIANINARVAQLPASGTINGTQLQQQVASLLYFSQTSVFPAVPAAANGTQALSDFTSQYSGASLTSGVSAALQSVTREAPAFASL